MKIAAPSIASARLFRERNRLVKEQKEVGSLNQYREIGFRFKINKYCASCALSFPSHPFGVLFYCTSLQMKYCISQTPLQLAFGRELDSSSQMYLVRVGRWKWGEAISCCFGLFCWQLGWEDTGWCFSVAELQAQPPAVGALRSDCIGGSGCTLSSSVRTPDLWVWRRGCSGPGGGWTQLFWKQLSV